MRVDAKPARYGAPKQEDHENSRAQLDAHQNPVALRRPPNAEAPKHNHGHHEEHANDGTQKSRGVEQTAIDVQRWLWQLTCTRQQEFRPFIVIDRLHPHCFGSDCSRTTRETHLGVPVLISTGSPTLPANKSTTTSRQGKQDDDRPRPRPRTTTGMRRIPVGRHDSSDPRSLVVCPRSLPRLTFSRGNALVLR